MSQPTLLHLPERFWAKVAVDESGCHIWTATIANNGYGQFSLDGLTKSAHRLAYRAARGPIPDGLQVDHLCRVRACVNPDHMELVTPAVNSQRKPAPEHVEHRREGATWWHAKRGAIAKRCPLCLGTK